MNPASVYSWMKENDPELLASSAMKDPKGSRRQRPLGLDPEFVLWLVNKSGARKDDSKAWLDYFFQTENYEKADRGDRRSLGPGLSGMTKTLPLFADTPHSRPSTPWPRTASSTATRPRPGRVGGGLSVQGGQPVLPEDAGRRHVRRRCRRLGADPDREHLKNDHGAATARAAHRTRNSVRI